MKVQFLLDASALLGSALDEGGHERVDRIVDRSRIQAVNLAEVPSEMPAERAVATVHEPHLEVEEEFGARQVEFCGALLGTRRDLVAGRLRMPDHGGMVEGDGGSPLAGA